MTRKIICLFCSLMCLLGVFLPSSDAQLADGHAKFLGNIAPLSGVPSDFATYWNQLTPENSGKWGFTEPQRDVVDLSTLQSMYQFCRNNGFPFKEHTFIWAGEEPDWIAGLPASEQREEVEEWIRIFGENFPDAEMIDVINEPLHTSPSFKEAIGGDGATGWDWVIWAFEKARQHCPNSDLLINDYSILNNGSNADDYLEIINLLQTRGLIDGIGVQGHGLETTPPAIIQTNLDKLAATGLPIYVSEFEVNRKNDNSQLSIYQSLFPVFWEHSGVAGVTGWGYRQGEIWKRNAYLVRSDGSERPALVWLRDYLSQGPPGGGNGTYIFISSLEADAVSTKGNKSGKIIATVTDDTGAPVPGAMVTGTFTGLVSGTVSGTTGSNGQVTLISTTSMKGGITFTFCVDNVSGLLPYDAGSNLETCDGLGSGFRLTEDFTQISKVEVYPNPARQRVRINGGNPGEPIYLKNSSGVLVKIFHSNHLDVSGLSKGYYILHFGFKSHPLVIL